MKKTIALALLCGLAACQTAPRPSAPPAAPNATAGSQSVSIAASPQAVHDTLVASAQEKGTPVIQDETNMVVMERRMTEANPALDKEFGPSDNGDRVIRIRVRFTGTECRTEAVQDLAIINNVRTALEQSFVLPGNANTMESLRGLKSRAEQGSPCPRI